MKKIKYLALFIITFILVVPSVSARTIVDHDSLVSNVGEYDKSAADKATKASNTATGYDYSAFGISTSTSDLSDHIFNIYKYNVNSTTYSMFCLDPNLGASTNDLYARRILLNGSNDIKVYAYDAAEMSILKTYYEEYSNGNNVGYMVANIAIRAVEAIWGYNRGGDPKVNTVYRAHYGQAYSWLQDAEAKSYYDKLVSHNALPSAATRYGILQNYKNDYFVDKGNAALLNVAKRYFINALKAAANAAEKRTSRTNIANASSPGEIVTTNDSRGTLLSREIKHTITLNNFDLKTNDASFELGDVLYKQSLNLIGVNNQPEIIKVEVKAGGKSYNVSRTGDLLKPLKDANVTANKIDIEVTVKISGYKTASYGNVLNCSAQPMGYTINYNYNDGSASSEFDNYMGISWWPKVASGNNLKQRFLSIEPVTSGADGNSSKITGKIDGSASLIENCGCEELVEACEKSGNKYSDECNALKNSNCSCDYLNTMCNVYNDWSACNNYNATCNVKCDTEVSADWVCCDDDNNTLLIQNSDNDYKDIEITGPNAMACFVNQVNNKKDSETGYSGVNVEDQNGNSYTLLSNKYCAVNCKEDYFMSLPTSQKVSAGRYFTFKAKISGTKTCYTNKIDRDAFESDIDDAQQDLVDAYNEYQKWKALYNGTMGYTDSEYISGYTCSRCTGTSSKTSYHKYWKANGTVTRWATLNANGTVTYSEMSVVDDELNIEYEKPSGSSTKTCGPSSWDCTDLSNCETPIKDDKGNQIGCSKYGTKTCDCSSNNYTYYTGKTTVNDETSYKNKLKDRMNEAEKALGTAQENYRKIIADYNDCSDWDTEIKYDPEVTYDYGENYVGLLQKNIGEMYGTKLDDDYDDWYCNGELTGNQYNRCSGTTAKSNSTKNYVYCDTTGCSRPNVTISDAKYKKVTSSVEYEYKPKTLFYNVYPSGEISVDDDTNNGVALENKLPVSLSKPRGIYKYTININDLGEFYNDSSRDNLGRYAGSSTAIVDKNGIEYDCTYLVNIGLREGETLTCNFKDGCTDNCTTNCVGPNCDGGCSGSFCSTNCLGVGCVYDSGEGTYLQQKSVSLSNLFPNGTASYNWDEDRNDKAEETISKIEGAGNSIYDSKPVLSITINPSTSSAIKKYNDRARNSGSYSNETLTCKDLGGYENVACYSNFITDLMAGRITYEGRTYLSNANIVNDSKALELRKVENNNSRYFILWNGNVSEKSMIGPSWRLGGND